MISAAAYLLAGTCLLLAVLLPTATRRFAVSPALVLMLVGVALGFTPVASHLHVDPIRDRVLVEHVTELTVLIALMGVGLALDRPLDLLRPATWRGWSPTWRLLAIAMPISIVAVALLGWLALGLGPGVALLLSAVLAPTDPVLASDVQVGGPGSAMSEDVDPAAPYSHDPTVVSEQGEVRFALTSEAGLNDGMAFPFVHAALLLTAGSSALGAAMGGGVPGVLGDVVEWLSWFLVAKTVIAVVVGVLVGRLLTRVAFRSHRPSLRMAEQNEPLLALAALLASYGLAELAEGYGFLAVFACAMALRSAERSHEYHVGMHSVIERLERLFTLAVLIALGVGLSSGLLDALDWRGVSVGVAVVLVVRPLAGWAAMALFPRRPGLPGGTTRRGRWTVAFFGVRGVGSIYYLAYAAGHGFEKGMGDLPWLWSTLAFTIGLSVVVHGIASTPVISRLTQDAAAPA